MIKKAILKTAGMFDNQDSDSDYELWKSIAEYMNGETAMVIESAYKNEEYVFLGLTDGEKNKELFYMMEQDSMTGVYINDRAAFEEIWKTGEYGRDECFYLEEKYLEFLEN